MLLIQLLWFPFRLAWKIIRFFYHHLSRIFKIWFKFVTKPVVFIYGKFELITLLYSDGYLTRKISKKSLTYTSKSYQKIIQFSLAYKILYLGVCVMGVTGTIKNIIKHNHTLLLAVSLIFQTILKSICICVAVICYNNTNGFKKT